MTHNLSVSPELFDYQLGFIKKNFNVINPDALLQLDIPPNAALITFDDGFRSFFKEAVPVLAKREMPAIVFLNVEPVNGKVFWAGLITYLCDRKPDFVRFLDEKSPLSRSSGPLFLRCSREIVEAYMESSDSQIESEVREFVGEFSNEEDLEKACGNRYVFFGNHLSNHYVPRLMSDEFLVQSYSDNRDALIKYPNYRDMFSFPFGQPDTCFTNPQVKLLLKHGAQRIFSSYPIVNPDISSPLLHRVPLTSQEDSWAKIWGRVLLPGMRLRIKQRLRAGK
ncbi:MAG: polysaccharide deacetylase family protein [Planctomycetes bacterium]|nr:polysaccharide deacetylase family protein [Planctomycetota bacterium]